MVVFAISERTRSWLSWPFPRKLTYYMTPWVRLEQDKAAMAMIWSEPLLFSPICWNWVADRSVVFDTSFETEKQSMQKEFWTLKSGYMKRWIYIGHGYCALVITIAENSLCVFYQIWATHPRMDGKDNSQLLILLPNFPQPKRREKERDKLWFILNWKNYAVHVSASQLVLMQRICIPIL